MKNTPTFILCGKCKEEKPAHLFHNCASRHNGKSYACKSCENERNKLRAKSKKGKEGSKRRQQTYRKKNPEAAAESQRKNKAKKQALIHEKKQGGCVICGYDRSMVGLDLHHVDETTKTGTVSDLIFSRGIKHVEEELKKCVVLCACCHRELHAGLIELPPNIDQTT